MKIGIITYHRSNNYGAQLQAYASRIVFQKIGCESEVVDCNSVGDGAIFRWSFASLRAFAGSLINNFLSLFYERKRRRYFRDFANNYIGLSRPCANKNDRNALMASYDYVVTGSDQVWHPQICEGNTVFFLDLPICSSQKIAYAPSFGVAEYTQEEVDKYMPLIKDIGHLSVREKSGQDLIYKYTGRVAKIVVDPTMLLDCEDWNRIAVPSKYNNYLFYFTILDEPEGTDDVVRRIAAYYGLRIIRIGTVRDIVKKDFISARASGPREFLGLVRDAEFIVTSSFHGAVFSILFNKPFLCICNKNDRNSRLETLVNNLGIDEYLVRDVNSYDHSNYRDINYVSVNYRLAALKNESLTFIKESLGR